MTHFKHYETPLFFIYNNFLSYIFIILKVYKLLSERGVFSQG